MTTQNKTGLELYVSAEEQRIAKWVVDAILERGYLVRVWEGEGWAHKASTRDRSEILGAMASTEADTLCISKPDATFGKMRIGSITLIWGNGCDLLSDWTDRPEVDEIARAVCQLIEEAVR